MDDVEQFTTDVNNWVEYEVAYDNNLQIQIYYIKDSSDYGSVGTDACYIDNIRLVGCGIDV